MDSLSAPKTVRLMDIQELIKSRPAEDHERLNICYVYAAQKHFGQLRQSGEPYLSHPLSVAYTLAEMDMDTNSILAGLLHDTLEDTDATMEELTELFGAEVAFLVDGLTKIGKIEFKSKEEKQAENFRKMLISMSQNIRVIIIKLADRLHNMRTIGALRPDKQRRIAQETLEIYAPLAHRLGIAKIKWELEDLSFMVLEPQEYEKIQNQVILNRADREDYINKVRDMVKDALEKEHVSASIDGRPKHFYSIYSKMVRKHTSFNEIYDLLALRIIVGTVSQCYTCLGIIHSLFKPIPSRFKDYIAMPKANMYQSLHTTVMGPEGQMVEFQIRTSIMHQIAEEGIAAHWKYKEGKDFDTQQDDQIVWLRQLLDQSVKNSEELVESLKEDVLPAQIYLFTPSGDVIELPEGATPIDFAYAIHSEVGNKYTGARVNGTLVNLKYKLHNGDKVEVITSPNQEPRKDWLNFVKTTRAKYRIRAHLRKKDSERAIAKGTSMLEKEFKEQEMTFREVLEKPAIVSKILDKLNFKTTEDMLTSVGFELTKPAKILHVVFPSTAPDKDDNIELQQPTRDSNSEPFIIDGIDNVVTKIAKCCTPLLGDDIVGYISSGRGIIIHKRSCENVNPNTVNTDRLIDVQWDENAKFRAPMRFSAHTVSRPGLINSITAVVKDMGLNIVEYSAKPMGGGESLQQFSVEVSNTEEVETLMNKIRQVAGVKELTRS